MRHITFSILANCSLTLARIAATGHLSKDKTPVHCTQNSYFAAEYMIHDLTLLYANMHMHMLIVPPEVGHRTWQIISVWGHSQVKYEVSRYPVHDACCQRTVDRLAAASVSVYFNH